VRISRPAGSSADRLRGRRQPSPAQYRAPQLAVSGTGSGTRGRDSPRQVPGVVHLLSSEPSQRWCKALEHKTLEHEAWSNGKRTRHLRRVKV
jgi:hypothetical protein